ncbi:2OG-Fe(II) oxygenase [Streptomyces sp. NPDC054797]
MIHIAETLGVHSFEGFLTPAAMNDLAQIMDRTLADRGRQHFDAERRSSIHEIPGHTTAEAQAVYEPAGRVEVTIIPGEAAALLDHALAEVLPRIRQALPSVSGHRPWMYLEYGPGQHITPHADGIAPDPHTRPRQIAAATVTLDTPHNGGAFYVETTGSTALWSSIAPAAATGYQSSMRFIHDGADNSSPWFRTMPRTRWTTSPAPGTLTAFGSQLIHGTEPVETGRVRKFLTLLVSE